MNTAQRKEAAISNRALDDTILSSLTAQSGRSKAVSEAIARQRAADLLADAATEARVRTPRRTNFHE